MRKLLLLFLALLQTAAWADTLGIVKVPVASVHRAAVTSSEQVTQVPMGDRVRIVATRGDWIQVEVPDQYRLKEGYPGWMLRSAVATVAPAEGDALTVTVPSAPLRAEARPRAAALTHAYMGTRLRPTGHESGSFVEITMPGTTKAGWVEKSAVASGPLPLDDRTDVLRAAEQFLKVPYLWGGLSVEGIDCSGLTFIVYRLYGIELPRDADQQFEVGDPVAPKDLQPGDLVFYGKAADHITHVAIYADDGKIVEASHEGGVRISTVNHRRDYQGARRIIGVTLHMPPPSP